MTMYKYLSEKVPSDCHYVLNKFGSYNATGNEEEKIVNKMAINSVVIGGFVLMGVALIIKK